MKFKVLKGSETYGKLMSIKSNANVAIKAANALVKELGGTKYCYRQRVAYGGISAIKFKEKPKGWKIAGRNWESLFYPKASEKELCKKVESLPVVKFEELNAAIKFTAPQTVSSERGLLWVNSFGLSFGKDYALIEIRAGAKYKPPKDVIEILESEYEKLAKKAR